MNPLPSDMFSRRLRQERERLSISQAELARRIAAILDTNVDASAVTRIEQQTRAVRLDEAVAAAEALGVPLTILLTEDPVAENEAQLQQSLVDLDLAQRAWEASRLEVQRQRQIVHNLGGGLAGPATSNQELADDLDNRVPLHGTEGRPYGADKTKGSTGPGA